MNENLEASPENISPEELELEKVLRPLSFDDFAGQERITENLKVFVEAARKRGEALDHVLLHGPPGLGKTTLANLIAESCNRPFYALSAINSGVKDIRGVIEKASRQGLFGNEKQAVNFSKGTW